MAAQRITSQQRFKINTASLARSMLPPCLFIPLPPLLSVYVTGLYLLHRTSMLSYHMIIRTVNYVGSVLQRFFQCFLHIFSILFYCQMHLLQRIKKFMQICHAVCTNDCIFLVRTISKNQNLGFYSIFCPLHFVKSLWLSRRKRLPFRWKCGFGRAVLGRNCGKVTNCALLTYVEVMESGNVIEGTVPQPQRSSKALGTGYALPFG